jgi:hypothetical protein
VACSSADPPDGGFATPAATVLSLALATGVVAVIAASHAELRSARTDFERTRIVHALAGGQEEAAVSLFGSAGGGTIRWSEQAAGRNLEVLAEPEALKASVAAVISMEDRALAPFRLVDPAALKERLKTLSITQAVNGGLAEADASPVWRACARALISPFGLGETLQPLSSASLSSDTPTGHAGEVWRVRVSDSSGWTDERVVRLTGDNLHPAATLERRFSKLGKEDTRCDSYFNNAS